MKDLSNLLQSSAIHTSDAELLGLMVDRLFRVDGRTVRLERINDRDVVELRDQQSLGLLRVRDQETGELSAPTVSWMRDAYAAGRLHLLGDVESAAERQSRFALLDPNACQLRDKKSLWRFSLAWRASADGTRKTDADFNAWLDSNFGKEKSDAEFPRPSASSLRRWVRSLEKGDKRVGCLVSQAGRQRGRSQLDPKIDALLHEAALWFWSRKRAKIVDAQAWLYSKVAELNAALPGATGRAQPYQMPSKEALRKRINRLRCFETVCAKEGLTSARKQFEGSGEPMRVDHILQVALMDATKLEQTIVFDPDWQLPACKVRITSLMDVCSHAILGFALYAGPNRFETSAEAILDCMYPTDYSTEALEDNPGLKYIFGRPAAILPDNEKALVGPTSLPGLNEANITLLEPPIEMPQAKAAKERFYRSLKEALAQLPGTMIDPKYAKDLDYDAVGSAALTLSQLRYLVTQIIALHNVSPSKGLDGLSPLQVWTQKASSRATPALEDPDRIRAVLSRTHDALLTRDGVEFKGIRYRDAVKVGALLDNLASTEERRRQRKDGSATVRVKIRRNDGNIDSIDVYDPSANEYVTLPSTQPEYTGNLTAWEHDTFTNMAKARRQSFKTQEQRLKLRGQIIRDIDHLAPRMAFQQRAEMAALYQSTQVDKLAGRKHRPFPSDAIIAPQDTSELMRKDHDAPAATAPQRNTKVRHEAPARPEGYGGVILEDAADQFDWDAIAVDTAPTLDPETGVQPPEQLPDDDQSSWADEA